MKCVECRAELFLPLQDLGETPVWRPYEGYSPYDTPFSCGECGAINFPYKAIRDVVFIWPCPLPEKFGKSSIEIPVQYREFYNNGFGILLSVGPGYYDDKKFRPVSKDLKVGSRVLYDCSVPWSCLVPDDKGKEHKVVCCGSQDVWCIAL